MRISDPMAPKTGSVRISRDTRFSFFGDPKEYGASRMYKPYCITITSSIIVRVVNSNYKRREETYFNRMCCHAHNQLPFHLFLPYIYIPSPIYAYTYIHILEPNLYSSLSAGTFDRFENSFFFSSLFVSLQQPRGEAERYTVLERWKSTESSLIEEGGEELVAMEGLSRNSSEKLLLLLLLVFMSR